jgi:hypothetical protein
MEGFGLWHNCTGDSLVLKSKRFLILENKVFVSMNSYDKNPGKFSVQKQSILKLELCNEEY